MLTGIVVTAAHFTLALLTTELVTCFDYAELHSLSLRSVKAFASLIFAAMHVHALVIATSGLLQWQHS